MTGARPALCVALLWLLGGCDPKPVAPRPTAGQLGPGVVAVVGAEPITAVEVSLVALASNSASKAARDAVVRDALFAAQADAELPEEVASAQRRTLARAMIHRIAADARLKPLDPKEAENWSLARFLDVDRPAGWRVVHGVVLVSAAASPEALVAARQHAELIRATIEPLVRAAAATPAPSRIARDIFFETAAVHEDAITESFRTALSAIPHGTLNVRFESLGVVSADGRYLDYGKSPWERMAEPFTRAASRLNERGDVSPIVETRFDAPTGELRGFHVLALLARTPEYKLDAAATRALLLPDIYDSRARAAYTELLELAARRIKVTMPRNAAALLDSIEFATNTSETAPGRTR